ncbi:MAG: alkaline phosphatase family protein, partial [Syntrophobacteraceae bacterium]|nr:alkaline phosphatase family protein [Syntrophobacteraceae bacterium]
MRRLRKTCVALSMAASLLQLPVGSAALAGTPPQDVGQSRGSAQQTSDVTAQPNVPQNLASYFIDPAGEKQVSQKQLISLLKKHIKYVFVIFNENHSFDHEYGTFPGVNGIYSDGSKPRSAANTPGFNQTYTDNVSGATVTVQPFRLGPGQNSSVMDSIDHSNTGMIAKYDVVNGVPQMDGYSKREYQRFAGASGTPAAAAQEEGTQFARLVMSHVDCDTIPFFWQYASRFTVFDNIFATEDGPSTPNAVAMLAGQMGQTQWVKHPYSNASQSVSSGGLTYTLAGPPLTGDPQPFWGSGLDLTPGNNSGKPPYVRQPLGARGAELPASGPYSVSASLTFASLPLTFQGKKVGDVLAKDPNYSEDAADIEMDIPYIQKFGSQPVNWGWFQEGYGLEATDTGGVASHNSYVSHHNGAQYFGYISNTPGITASMHGLTDFFTDMTNNSLPAGGVFYIRGGYTDQKGKTAVVTDSNTPADEIAAIKAAKSGDDDHPSYTDRQLSEAMAARVINAVASN